MADTSPVTKNDEPTLKRRRRFNVGVFFLVINTPIGYGGGFLATAIGFKTGYPVLGTSVGIGIYILSWSMLGLGVWMAGPEGIKRVKDLHRKWFRKKNNFK